MAKGQHPQSPEKQHRQLKKRRIERENAIADLNQNAVESIRVDPHVHRQSTRMPPRSASLRSPETTHHQDTQPTTSSIAIATLPTEIIDLIFEQVVPMDHLLRGRPILLLNGRRVNDALRASMAMKMNILLVCKTWAACGYRFLYRHIILLSFSNVESLARKLEADPALGSLVHSLTFLYHCATVNKTKMEDACADLVASIVTKCPRARHLEISTSGAFLPNFGEETAVCIARAKGDETLKPPNPKWQTAVDQLATALPPQITSLALGAQTRDWDFGAVMLQTSCSRLVDLRVPVEMLLVPRRPYIREKGAVWNGIQPRLVFPNLRTVQLRCQGEVGRLTSSDRRRVILGDWPGAREVSVFPDMTSLAHLVFIVHQPALTYWMRQRVLAEFELCLNLYGNGVEYLQFPAMSLQGDEYSRLLQKCPRLAHVVLPAAVSWPDDPASIFSSVKHVDLWYSAAELESGGVDVGNLALTVRKSLPEVKTIRRLSTALQDVFVDAFPRALDSAVTWIRGTVEVAPGTVLTREEHTEGVTTIRMLAEVAGGDSV